jgi:malonyl-CoA/methylmalonyl-CoA synthetase
LEVVAHHDRAEIVERETGRSTTIGRAMERASRIARALERRHGSLVGLRVLLALPPGIDWVEAFLAILACRAVAVPLPLAAPAPEVAYFASDSGATLAIADDERSARLPPGLPVFGPRFPIEAGLDDAPSKLEARADDVALLLYTSGTTGKPKGARLTHANLAAQVDVLQRAWGMTERDVLLHVLPLHHLHGVVVALLHALTTPCRVHVLARFDASRVIEELRDATVFMAVPTMYQRLLDAADALDAEARAAFESNARGLRLATSGSAALPASLAERWRGITGAIPLERYGMTEIGMALSNPLDPSARRAGTVGLPLPTVELRLVDESGADAEVGELWVRGPSVFAGYHERDDATRAAFRDGWFLTGDVGRREDGGVIRLLGRTSVDILKTGGEKVSALEIEEALREHPAVAEIAVVGLPDPAWGDRVTAAVVLREGAELSIEGLRAWARSRLVAYKIPQSLVVMAALPRNAMGKVEKKRLIEIVLTGS